MNDPRLGCVIVPHVASRGRKRRLVWGFIWWVVLPSIILWCVGMCTHKLVIVGLTDRHELVSRVAALETHQANCDGHEAVQRCVEITDRCVNHMVDVASTDGN